MEIELYKTKYSILHNINYSSYNNISENSIISLFKIYFIIEQSGKLAINKKSIIKCFDDALI